MTSDEKAARIALGIEFIQRLQNDYAPLIDNDNLPFYAAGLIVADGPYDGIVSDLDELIDAMKEATSVVENIRNAIHRRESGQTAA